MRRHHERCKQKKDAGMLVVVVVGSRCKGRLGRSSIQLDVRDPNLVARKTTYQVRNRGV